MLNFTHLKLIQALSEYGNVSLAADALYVSQSALSHQIKKLESLLDKKIFVRHSQPLALTVIGKTLKVLADEILPKINHFEQQFIKQEFSRLNIAIECHACFEWLMPTLNAFSKQQPNVSYDLSMAFSFEPFEALKRYAVDMVVTSDPMANDSYQYYALFDYQVFMLLSKQNSLSKKLFLQPRDIINETLLIYPVALHRLDVFNYFLSQDQIKPKQIRTVELPIIMVQLVQNNQGICTMPQWALTSHYNDNITLKPLGASGLWRTLYLAIRQSDVKIPYMQAFIELAKEISLQTLKHIKPRNH